MQEKREAAKKALNEAIAASDKVFKEAAKAARKTCDEAIDVAEDVAWEARHAAVVAADKAYRDAIEQFLRERKAKRKANAG